MFWCFSWPTFSPRYQSICQSGNLWKRRGSPDWTFHRTQPICERSTDFVTSFFSHKHRNVVINCSSWVKQGRNMWKWHNQCDSFHEEGRENRHCVGSYICFFSWDLRPIIAYHFHWLSVETWSMWFWLLKMILKKVDHSVASGEGLESFGPGRGFAFLKFSVTTKMNRPKLGCH